MAVHSISVEAVRVLLTERNDGWEARIVQSVADLEAELKASKYQVREHYHNNWQ